MEITAWPTRSRPWASGAPAPCYDFTDVNKAIDDSDSGKAIKPVIRMR